MTSDDDASGSTLSPRERVTTFRDLAGLEPSPSGRFARQVHTVTDHMLPADRFRAPQWSKDLASVPIEPPLGVSVDEMEAAGTAVEIEASIAGAAPEPVSFARRPLEP